MNIRYFPSPRLLLLIACTWLNIAPGLGAASPRPYELYGMNLNWNAYWLPCYYFNNQIMNTDAWLGTTPDDLPVDEDGWPTSLNGSTGVGMPFFLSNGNHYPLGEYVLEWEGDGEVSFMGYAGGPVATLVSETSNRKVYSVTTRSTQGGFRVLWIRTAPAPNHVRNVKVWLPGQEDNPNLMHPDALSDHEGVNVIRPMQLTRTNNSTEREWADRTLPNAPRQNPIAWEHIITMANELDSDLWLCVPHAATDEYVRELARLTRDNLNDHLRVWIEYGNEVWNTAAAFYQHTNYVNTMFPGNNLAERYSYRATQIFDIWEVEFGGLDRIVRVIATRTMDPAQAELRLAAANGKVDALAIATYYAGNHDDWVVESWPVTNEEFKNFILNTDPNRPVNTFMKNVWKQNADFAKAHGVDLVAYEGGPHIRSNLSSNTPEGQFIRNFHNSEENAEIYRQVLDYFSEIGLLTNCAFENYGHLQTSASFGHRHYTGQPLSETPKWRTLIEWAEAHKAYPAPELIQSVLADDELVVEWTVETGLSVVVETSTDLSEWQTFEEKISGGASDTTRVPFPAEDSALFMRVRVEPPAQDTLTQ